MSVTQVKQSYGGINGITQDDKGNQTTRYALASETGLDGPDQILPADADTTCNANSRVRIKLDSNGLNSTMPVSIPGIFTKTAKRYPNHIALVSRPDANGKRTTYTFQEYESSVRTVAKAFLKLGLERYHSVCILGFNSPEWFIADLAAIFAGGFATGIYTTNSPEACQYCAEHSRANIIVVEDEKQLQKILQIKHNLPDLKAIVQYEGVPTEKNILSWNNLLDIGKKESEDKLQSVLKTIGVNECCTLVYTSGTVGNPKAVMLSHDNVLHDLRMLLSAVGNTLKEKSEVVISYLPLSHVAAQMIDIICNVVLATTVYFADPGALKGTLINTLSIAQPTIFLGVPRVWEKIYEKMQEKAHSNGAIKTWIAKWAKAQGLCYYTNKLNGVDHKHWGYIFAKWLVFDKVKAVLGFNRCQIFVTAAAPLNTDIKKYFMSLDMPLLEAYGMSECGGAQTITSKDYMEGVGRPLPGVYTKLDNIDEHGEGEVCMSGRHVFMGYLKAPEKTEEAKDKSGWLHSGDLGKFDSNGNLFITGRIKELIITSGGENVAPYNIEQAILSELSYLSNAMVIGDKRKYLTVLVTLKSNMDAETGAPLDTLNSDVLKWAQSIGSSAKTVTEVINSRDPAIYEEINKAIKKANTQAISNAQKVQKFEILPHDFSIPTGELGPTLKLKKNVVQKMYADLINKMYE